MVDGRGHAALWQDAISADLGSQLHRLWAGPVHQRLIQQHMQLAPMCGILRPAVPRVSAARFGVNLLPLLSDQCPFARRHTDLVQLGGGEPQIKKLAHGIGLDVDPHTQRFQGADLFIYRAAHAKLMQREGQCKAADSAACDQDMGLGHRTGPLSTEGRFVLRRTSFIDC